MGNVVDKHYVVVTDSDQYKEMLNHIKVSDLLAFDTETTGLNVREDKVIGFSVSGKTGYGYYYPIYSWNGEALEMLGSNEEVSELLKNIKSKKLICHNASFDIRMVKNDLGVDLTDSLYCDTIVLKHTVDEDYPFRLKDIAKKIQSHIGLNVSEDANKEQLDMVESIKAAGGSVTKDKYELYKADYIKIGVYGAADTDLTLRVFEYYNDKLKEQGLENFFYNVEVMPLLKEVTIPMEDRGIPVDVEYIKQAQEEINNDINYLEEEIQRLISPYLGKVFEPWFLNNSFPPSRTGVFAQYVCEYADLDLPRTNTGKYSLSAAAVEKLSPSIFKDFLLNNGEKSKDTYLDPDIVLEIQRLAFKREFPGEYMFSLSSKYHLAKLFFDTLEEKPLTRTDKGNPQMNHFFLDSVADKYDFVPLLIDYNKLNKIKSSYIDRILDRQQGGIFYPSFMQHRTVSGRYGSDLQQLPRPLEEGQASPMVIKHNNKVRKFFISGPGRLFIDNDYESLEPHVFSHVSGDDGLKNIFKEGNDFYSTIAIGAENLEGVTADKKAPNYLGKVNKPLRQKAKAYALGIPYGMESFKLSKDLDISQDEAQAIIDNYLASFPRLKQWMERSEADAKFRGMVRSEAGRVRHLDSARKIYFGNKNTLFDKNGELKDSLQLWKDFAKSSPGDYQRLRSLRKTYKNLINNAKNFQIQSLSASIVNRAAIKINRELRRQGVDGYVCAQIHDQLIVSVPEKAANKCAKMVKYIMENNYKLSVDLKAPPEIAKDFYEGH